MDDFISINYITNILSFQGLPLLRLSDGISTDFDPQPFSTLPKLKDLELARRSGSFNPVPVGGFTLLEGLHIIVDCENEDSQRSAVMAGFFTGGRRYT